MTTLRRAVSMHWHDLLFAHWRIDAAVLRPHGPMPLSIETFDGSAWIAVVPFRMARVRARFMPPLPLLSAFPELNLRTYVTHGGRAGVWFFSLDAAQPLAVRVARRGFSLPYFDAEMRCALRTDGGVEYSSERTHRGVVPASLRCSYRPVGAPFRALQGSLEHFLCERYSLFARDRKGRILRGDIEHEPWPLQRAEWDVERCAMTALLDHRLQGAPESLLFARELRVWAALPVPSEAQSQGSSC